MSIKSGQRYKIKNEENGQVLDLRSRTSNVYHYHSIVGSHFHGDVNQQWIAEEQDDGQWTFQSQSLAGQKYLGFENTPRDGTPLVGLDKPQLWDIEVLSDSDDYDNLSVRLWVRDTLFVVELSSKEKGGIIPVELRAARDGRDQVWVLEEYS